MITCGKCQRQNETHYKFCLGCGTPLTQPEPEAPAAAPVEEAQSAAPAAAAETFVTCPQCMARVPSGKRFCLSCGSPIPSDAAPAPAPDPAALAAAAVAPAAAAPAAAAPAAEPAAEPAPIEPATPAVAPVEPAAATPAPAASAPPLAHLIMVNPDGTPGDSVPLYDGTNTVGRNSEFPVLKNDDCLSPDHATFTIRGNEVEIQDLNSINGVYYRISKPEVITPGDFVRLGREVLLLQSPSSFPKDESLRSDVGSELGEVYGRVARISQPEDKASFAFLLWKNEHTIGRERGDVTIPDDGFVSGLHARIYREGDNVFIEDLKSSNGTYLRIKGSRTVPNNTLLLMGQQPYRLKFVD